MKVKLKRDEIHLIYTTLFSIPLDLRVHKVFNFYIETILASLKDYFTPIDALKRDMAPSGEYLEFMNKRKELQDKYTSEVDGKVFIIESTKETFEKLYKELIEVYSDYVIEHDSYGAEVGTILNEVIEVEIEKIPFKYFPDYLPRDIYQVLNSLRKESDEELLGRYK